VQRARHNLTIDLTAQSSGCSMQVHDWEDD
jgi:hypothetical protein